MPASRRHPAARPARLEGGYICDNGARGARFPVGFGARGFYVSAAQNRSMRVQASASASVEVA